ncbi:MAG: hypothetical protein ABEJ30_00305 [Halorientalis sp.]
MEVWTWLLAYVVGFCLLQLLVYRYVRESGPSVEGPGDGYVGRTDGGDRDVGAAESGEGGVACPHCGASNESAGAYRYCKRCVTPLG